jgi:acid phosphatase (class A)
MSTALDWGFRPMEFHGAKREDAVGVPRGMMTPQQLLIGGAAVVAAGLVAHYAPTFTSAGAEKTVPKVAAFGYLSGAVPEGLASLPPSPAPGSPAMQKDEEARKAALQLNDRARYAEAVIDSDRSFPTTMKTFSCAMGMDISEQATPRLAHLLSKMRIDIRHASGSLRDRYKRKQPFVTYKTPTCSPKDEALIANQGSYPSARSAVGWSYALVLAELNPERAAAILQRGRDFGQSRVICDAHWQSDVDAGNEVGRLVVARLHQEKEFVADFQAAKAEVGQLRASGARPSGQCNRPGALASR